MAISVTKPSQPKAQIDTILSALIPSLPTSQQNATVWSWQGKAKRVFINGIMDFTPYTGLNVVMDGAPSLARILTAYTMKIPGGEAFCLCAPNVNISEDQGRLFDFVRRSGIEWGWGSYHKVEGNDYPAAFIMSAAALPFVVRYTHPETTLDGYGWSKWMMDHLTKAMGAKLFDGSRFKIISPWIPQQQPAINLVKG